MDKYSNFILRNRLLVIFLTLILVGTAFSGAFTNGQWSIPFKSDYKIFFKEDNTQLNNYLDLQKIYSKSDNVAFIVAPKNGNVFTKETL
ncbi:MAG: RND family transporter, partial [Gammaproteobacteria bacterium]|nr:RND family transporter [Gammaproteobacteria bacterium]